MAVEHEQAMTHRMPAVNGRVGHTYTPTCDAPGLPRGEDG